MQIVGEEIAADRAQHFDVVAAHNNYGIGAQGIGAMVGIAQLNETGYTSGWQASAGGVVLSYGNNSINGNGANEAAPFSIALK